jgi:NAD(P)H-nitrite reductase large subunit
MKSGKNNDTVVKDMEKFKYLIIGNSAAGVGAAEAIREVDRDGMLAIVSDEPYPAYSRPMISQYLAERCPLERMLYRPPSFYEQNRIISHLGIRVTRIDTAGHTVELDNGRTIAWEKLFLGTGGVPIVPRMAGGERPGVFTFTTLEDARAIDRYLEGLGTGQPVRAVVIGGGLIGASVTEALLKRSVRVTMVEMKERILNVMLDEEGSALEAAQLEKLGVTILTNRTVATITGEGDRGPIHGVSLDNGQALPAEMTIVAIGVRPRLDLATASGLRVNRGVVVDRFMVTSHPDIYAAGDGAEAYDFIYEENRLTPVWPNAYLGGRVAGFNMAGRSTRYEGGTALNALKYFGLDIVSAGVVNPPDATYETLSRKYEGGIYRKVIMKDGRLAGLVMSGNIEKSGLIYGLLRDRVPVAEFAPQLVARDFTLSALPEAIWRSRLEAPEAVSMLLAAVPDTRDDETGGD